MGLGMIVALVVLLAVAVVAAAGYLMDASVPDTGEEEGTVPPARAGRR